MTDQETWEKACVRVGVWNPNADSDEIPAQKQAELKSKFNMYLPAKCPPIDDPAACMAMLEWLRQNEKGDVGFWWENEIVECVISAHFSGRGSTISKALSAAICAMPEVAR